jgi:hypothetical protein
MRQICLPRVYLTNPSVYMFGYLSKNSNVHVLNKMCALVKAIQKRVQLSHVCVSKIFVFVYLVLFVIFSLRCIMRGMRNKLLPLFQLSASLIS